MTGAGFRRVGQGCALAAQGALGVCCQAKLWPTLPMLRITYVQIVEMATGQP